MSVAALYNLELKDPASRERWAFHNMGEHFKIQAAIFRKFNLNVPIFPCDPITLNDIPTWARNHQSMHSSANGILGLQGNDLTDVDLSKPEDVEVFKYLHAQEHQRFQLALGLS